MLIDENSHMSALDLIPVIDVMSGRAVHARGDDARSGYRALCTALCPDSDPLAVADAFVALHPFRTLYIADLDAITGAGDNFRTIRTLRSRHPGLELWVDAGIRHRDDYRRVRESELGVAVIGSETLRDRALLEEVADRHGGDAILSLDFRERAFLGPAGLESEPERWPQRLIVMGLARIGGSRGPAVSLVERTVGLAGGRAVFAAGGIRDNADLQRLQAVGARGVLLASALHSGRLDSSHLGAYR